jgi:hypothetical protein
MSSGALALRSSRSVSATRPGAAGSGRGSGSALAPP